MTPSRLTKTYQPNPLLAKLYARFFENIKVDDRWVASVRELAANGTVVYVLRNLNFIDFFALDHLTKRYALPQIRFVNDLGLGLLNPMGKGWLNAVLPNGASEVEEFRDALQGGGSAALFLKRPPGVRDMASGASGGRGLKEGEELVRELFCLQRAQDKPIYLAPQVIMWSKRPDTRGARPLDFFLGPREWPSPARTLGQFLYNYKHVALKMGEPVSLAEFMSDASADDDALVRRVTYTVLRRLERERRSITGPAEKAPDRVRMEIVRSPRLRQVISELAGEKPVDRAVLAGRALGMLRELQATPELATLKGLEVVINRTFHRIYAGIEYDKRDVERVRAAAREGALVLLPSHKSHIDYLILSYVFNEENLPLPMIAAGDNLNFFPLGPIFRRAGAFFIRRTFRGDRLYSAVVDAYVRRLIRDGNAIELFLEGGRSRTGKLLPPKFGLLNMVVDAALALPQRDSFFVPVSIGYERVIEASSYERELSGGEKEREDAAGLLRTPKVLRHRYGRINLQFGNILSLRELREETGAVEGQLTPAKRRGLVTRLGNRVMDEINRVTAVTPGALTALVLLNQNKRGTSHEELIDTCEKYLDELMSMGAKLAPTMHVSGTLRPEAIREALQMFIDAELVRAHSVEAAERSWKRKGRGVQAGPQAFYSVPEEKRLALDTSKNIIIHFFVERGLVAMALRMPPAGTVTRAVARERVQAMSRLLKYEFRFRAGASFDEIFDRTLEAMIERKQLALEGDVLVPSGGDGWSGQRWLQLYASALRNFLEGYWVAARSLSVLLKGAMVEKELVKKALGIGQRMYLDGELSRREAVSKPIISNALTAFGDQGYVLRRDDKLELAESFRSPDAVGAVENKMKVFCSEVD